MCPKSQYTLVQILCAADGPLGSERISIVPLGIESSPMV